MTTTLPTAAPTLPNATTGTGSDFAALRRRVDAAGLLDRHLGSYASGVTATLSLYVAVWFAIIRLGDSWLQCVTAVALGIAYTQVAFLGHDAGHQQIYRGRRR